MRLIKVLCCAGAVLAFTTPGTLAQDYDKTTYFTFSSPVQLPGMVLPAGEYMFKLANPESGRRAIQILDKDGSKVHGLVMTVTDERLRTSATNPSEMKDSVVMFGESPAGEPQAVRSWFYSGDTLGYEFIYPKDQAMKIAKASGTPVMAVDTASGTAAGSAEVGRIDASGQRVKDVTATATTGSATTTTTTAAADTRPTPTANRSEAQTPAAPATPAASATATATTTTASTPSADDRAEIVSPHPSPETAAARAAASADAPRSARAEQNQAVGTAGQQQELPRTASRLHVLQLFSAAALLSGLMLRGWRKRFAANV